MSLALAYAKNLRGKDLFAETLQLGREYERADVDDSSDDEPEDPAEYRAQHPSRKHLDRSRVRLDAVGILIERRYITKWIKTGAVSSIHCFADGSPVTGEEVQGMQVDIVLRNAEVHRIRLPGVALHYGAVSALDKQLAFMWVVFLICGPDLPLMREFYSKVTSFTTDYGTELAMSDTPDLLPAFWGFIHHKKLTDMPRVLRTSRLMPRCLKIGGWSHTCGNLMRDVVKTWPKWPQYLTFLRAFISFLKNVSYRRHFKRWILNLHGVDTEHLLDHWSANLAKWRFETTHKVLHDFQPVRSLFEFYFTQHAFNHAQDVETIKTMVQALEDPMFLPWCSATLKFILTPIEHLRRWGLVCGCPDHVKDRHDHPSRQIKCVNNSRRMDEAADHVKQEVQAMENKARLLTEEEVEGNKELWTAMKRMAAYAVSTLKLKFAFLNMLPWIFANAVDQTVAIEILRQWRAYPREQHDGVTICLMDAFVTDVEGVARGEHASERLEQ